MPMKRKSAAAQQRQVDAWTHPIGTPVAVRRDSGTVLETVTTSPAWLLGGHTAVIMVDGISGAYLLERVRVREPRPVVTAEIAAEDARDGERDERVVAGRAGRE